MELLELAKKILDLNPNASLTGSLMLKIRGIDLGREPHDIDILIRDYAPKCVLPSDLKIEKSNASSCGTGIKYKCGDIEIDIMSSSEEPEIIDGWRLGKVQELMEAKYDYFKKEGEVAKKHYDDLVKLGFNFPFPL
jgi:hypothetical protein